MTEGMCIRLGLKPPCLIVFIQFVAVVVLLFRDQIHEGAQEEDSPAIRISRDYRIDAIHIWGSLKD